MMLAVGALFIFLNKLAHNKIQINSPAADDLEI